MAGLGFGQSNQEPSRFRPLRPVGSITDTTFPGNLAATINGSLPFRPIRFPRFATFSPFWAAPNYLPSYIPVPPISIQQVNAPAVVIQQPTPVAAPAAEEATVKVYENPVRREAELAEPVLPAKAALPDDQPLYLFALTDGTVVTAIAYWTDGSEVKYITPDRKQKQVPLDRIDLPVSTRLNQKTGFPIHLASE